MRDCDLTLEWADLDAIVAQLAKISIDETTSTYDMASGSGIVADCDSNEIEPNVDFDALYEEQYEDY